MISLRSSLFLVVTTLVIAAVSSGCGFLGVRANPRVAKITRESDTSRSSTSFDYDDDGRLTEVDDEFQVIELEWQDGQLVEVTTSAGDGDGDEFARDLEYENGRLVELKGEIGGEDDVTSIEYDKLGRIEKIERDQLDGKSVSTSLFEYDDAGRVVEIVARSVFETIDEFGDDELIRSETKTEMEYEDGRLVKVTFSSDNQEAELEQEYEDGRLVKMDISSVFEDSDGDENESGGSIDFEYNDDGLIETAELDSDGSDDGLTIEIDYDDGEAVDLDVTPINTLFFVPFFDMRGNAYSSIDTRTQAARVAGVTW